MGLRWLSSISVILHSFVFLNVAYYFIVIYNISSPVIYSNKKDSDKTEKCVEKYLSKKYKGNIDIFIKWQENRSTNTVSEICLWCVYDYYFYELLFII